MVDGFPTEAWLTTSPLFAYGPLIHWLPKIILFKDKAPALKSEGFSVRNSQVLINISTIDHAECICT